MFTDNYRAFLASLVAPGATLLNFTDYAGTTRSVYGTPPSSAFPTNVGLGYSSTDNATGIKLGTGTKAPTGDDYNLEHLITSGLGVSVSRRTRLDDGNPAQTFTLGVTNNGDATVTVGEVGWFNRIAYASGSYAVAMFDRTTLDAPLAIPAGESATITYTLKSIVGD